jgi:class 3 adenylate cyclase
MNEPGTKGESVNEQEIRYYKNQTNELANSVLKFQYLNAELSNESKQMKRGLALISDLKGYDSRSATLTEVYEHFAENILVKMSMDYALVIDNVGKKIYTIVTARGYSYEDSGMLTGQQISFPEEYFIKPEPFIITSESQIPEWLKELKSSLKLEFFIITPVFDEDTIFCFLITGRRTERKGFAYSKLMPHDLNILQAIAGIISTIKNHIEQTIVLENKVTERTHQLFLEKKKSDDLLLNILPAEVAEELKQKGSAEARQFDNVTVMFTDFKDFTKISEKLSPTELVAEIDTCFKAFDHIITRHNIEKIKTIGDSYMCAGGLPVPNKTNATDVVQAALEIQQFMKQHFQQRREENKYVFELRTGIHTGPVVAGIVGVKKFAYDIWGDTVNIASRMESSGEAGKVNISESTYALVKDKFTCTHRGKIQAKNKGEVDMYFVKRLPMGE